MAIASKAKTLGMKAFDKTKTAKAALSTAMMVAATQVMPVFCLNANLNMDDLAGRIIGMILTGIMYIGIGVAIFGAGNIVFSLQREDSDGFTRALRTFFAGGGAVCISWFTGPILTYVGITVVMP